LKKKKDTRKEKPQLNVSPEDRFTVTTKRDNNDYQIQIRDNWSKILFKENLKGITNWARVHDITITDAENENEVLKAIEEGKDILRKAFNKEREKQCKSKK